MEPSAGFWAEQCGHSGQQAHPSLGSILPAFVCIRAPMQGGGGRALPRPIRQVTAKLSIPLQGVHLPVPQLSCTGPSVAPLPLLACPPPPGKCPSSIRPTRASPKTYPNLTSAASSICVLKEADGRPRPRPRLGAAGEVLSQPHALMHCLAGSLKAGWGQFFVISHRLTLLNAGRRMFCCYKDH